MTRNNLLIPIVLISLGIIMLVNSPQTEDIPILSDIQSKFKQVSSSGISDIFTNGSGITGTTVSRISNQIGDTTPSTPKTHTLIASASVTSTGLDNAGRCLPFTVRNYQGYYNNASDSNYVLLGTSTDCWDTNIDPQRYTQLTITNAILKSGDRIEIWCEPYVTYNNVNQPFSTCIYLLSVDNITVSPTGGFISKSLIVSTQKITGWVY